MSARPAKPRSGPLHIGIVTLPGRVCLGSMRVPGETAVKSITAWQVSFFRSQFTHPNGAMRLTSYRGGFMSLWKSLKNSNLPFPTEFLTDARRRCRSSSSENEVMVNTAFIWCCCGGECAWWS